MHSAHKRAVRELLMSFSALYPTVVTSTVVRGAAVCLTAWFMLHASHINCSECELVTLVVATFYKSREWTGKKLTQDFLSKVFKVSTSSLRRKTPDIHEVLNLLLQRN